MTSKFETFEKFEFSKLKVQNCRSLKVGIVYLAKLFGIGVPMIDGFTRVACLILAEVVPLPVVTLLPLEPFIPVIGARELLVASCVPCVAV